MQWTVEIQPEMAVTRALTPSLLPAVRFEATESRNGAPPPRNPRPPLPLLSVSKPSWIVKTESNVRIEQKKKPDPPCLVCSGSGRVDCHHCRGRDLRQDEFCSSNDASERGMAKMVQDLRW
ncbi:uncharacterized protein LOC114295203 isoform X2 [Camellia sinensis]|uniref:uncharacterized protein LOC114295203 isoform X2 n=1 Tax=Camellia sinensis TaxID=4442 RepID=UPI0010368E96|nr:uncharacterized protein LOC114295203 isoform X2 [Camellia sinensis]